MIRALLLVSLVPCAFCAFGGLVGRSQSAGATGILHCNGQPAPNVLIKMYDDDRVHTMVVHCHCAVFSNNEQDIRCTKPVHAIPKYTRWLFTFTERSPSNGLDMDDFMGETTTDAEGRFELSGVNAEMSPIDPKINIYHDCEDWWWPCQRKISIMIPDEYITVGNRPREYYDAGTIELAGEYAGEERDCLH